MVEQEYEFSYKKLFGLLALLAIIALAFNVYDIRDTAIGFASGFGQGEQPKEATSAFGGISQAEAQRNLAGKVTWNDKGNYWQNESFGYSANGLFKLQAATDLPGKPLPEQPKQTGYFPILSTPLKEIQRWVNEGFKTIIPYNNKVYEVSGKTTDKRRVVPEDDFRNTFQNLRDAAFTPGQSQDVGVYIHAGLDSWFVGQNVFLPEDKDGNWLVVTLDDNGEYKFYPIDKDATNLPSEGKTWEDIFPSAPATSEQTGSQTGGSFPAQGIARSWANLEGSGSPAASGTSAPTSASGWSSLH